MKVRRAAFRLGICAAAVLGTAGLLVALAVFLPQMVLPLVERAIAPAGGTATVAGMKLTLFPPALALEGLDVTGPAGEGERLRLDSLRAEADPGRLMGGGPWLRRVEASGLVFERLRPYGTPGAVELTPLEWMFRIENLSLAEARFRIAFPWGILAAEELNMSLLPGEGGIRRFRGDGEFSASRDGNPLGGGRFEARGEAEPGPAIVLALTVDPARLDLPWIGGEVSGQIDLRVTREGVRAGEILLNMPGARLGPDGNGLPGTWAVRLNAAGSLALDGSQPVVAVRNLEIGDLLRAQGRMSGPAPESMSGTVEGKVHRAERMKPVLTSGWDGRLEGVDLAGDLTFRADVAARGTDRELALELQSRGLLVSLPQEGLACRLGGTMKAAGSLAEWRAGKAALEGTLRGTGSLERSPLRVRSFRLDVPLSGGMAAPVLPGWRISAGEGEVFYDGQALPLGALDVRGAAAADGDSLRLENLDVRSQALGRLTGGMAIRGGRIDGHLKGRDIAFRSLPSLAGILAGRDWKNWKSEGTIDVDARLSPDGEGTRVAADVSMDRIGFRSPAADAMGQNLGGSLSVDARLGSRSRVAAELKIGPGEALWNTVYVDLSRAPLALHARLTRPGPGRYENIALEGDWADFGAFRLEGGSLREEEGWRHRGNILLRVATLNPVFRTFVRDPLAPSRPDLAGLMMEGAARLDLSFSGSENEARISGRLGLRVDHVRREEEPPILSGLDMDLPIAYVLGIPDPGTAEPTGDPGWGSLRLERLRLGGQGIGPVEAPVALVPNRLYFGGSIDASLFGATMHMRRIRVEEPFSPSFRMHLAVRMDGLDLSRISGESIPLAGRLGGTLDPVSVGRESLRASGVLSGYFFGGRMEISNATVDRPFGPGREVGADVDVGMVDLERLSAALGIGRITGRLSGSVRGLRIAYRQPVAFHLRMWSEPAAGVPQLVSLKAVNSISLLSTGASLGGLGYSLMTSFFREFSYEKIGIECSLGNDVFTVRGLIREEGVEYLVKRPFLGGINVINRNPDNRISFSDMVERLKRVTAGDTIEKRGGALPEVPVFGRGRPGMPGRRDGEDPSGCRDTTTRREEPCGGPPIDNGISPSLRLSASRAASR